MGTTRAAKTQAALYLLVGCSLFAATTTSARPVRALRQVNQSLPPGQSVTDVVTSLIKTIDAAAPAPGAITAGNPSEASEVAFANKYEAIVAAGLPSALYRYGGDAAGATGIAPSPQQQAQALAFLRGALDFVNQQNQLAALETGSGRALAPTPVATSLTDASNQLAAVLAERLVSDSVEEVDTGGLTLASGPSADTKDLFKYVLASELEGGIAAAESPASAINLLAGLVQNGVVSGGFAGTNILGIANGANSLEAAAVQAGEQLIGSNGAIPQAPSAGAARGALAPAPAVNLVNNGL